MKLIKIVLAVAALSIGVTLTGFAAAPASHGNPAGWSAAYASVCGKQRLVELSRKNASVYFTYNSQGQLTSENVAVKEGYIRTHMHCSYEGSVGNLNHPWVFYTGKMNLLAKAQGYGAVIYFSYDHKGNTIYINAAYPKGVTCSISKYN